MAYDAGDYNASLDEGAGACRLQGLWQAQARSERNGKLRGIGFSTYIEACGIAPSAAVGSLGAGVGLVGVGRGAGQPDRLGRGPDRLAISHGQGHETTFAQLVSERLGIPIENVSIVHGDTDKVQFGMGTYGSRSGAVGMSAIVKALDKVEAKAKKIAAHLLEAAEGDIVFKDGKFTVAGTDKSVGLGRRRARTPISRTSSPASELEPGLKEGAFYDPTNFTFPAGCHICEVEIDPETGDTDVVGWTAVDDFGTVINPMIVEGQVHGGVAQGVGQALLETRGLRRQRPARDRLATWTTPCRAPTTCRRFKVDTTVTKCPSNPLGIKGCGEAGAIAAPAAVMNAITDAIGTEDIAMPATPRGRLGGDRRNINKRREQAAEE